MTDPCIPLANDFPSSSQEQWRALADKALRGAEFEKMLVRHNEDGLALGPLFTKAKSSSHLSKTRAPHLSGRPWYICAEIEHPDIEHANTDILADLKGGVSALSLSIDPHGQSGIALRSKADVQRLLSGVHTELVPLDLVPSLHNFEAGALLAAHFKNHSEREKIHLSLGYTPGGEDNEKMLSLARYACAHAPHWKILNVNGAALHESGASAAQELAFMAARLVSYLRPLCTEHDITEALDLIDVRLTADQDAHFNIVKFRAARMIWAKLLGEFGVDADDKPLSLHGVSSQRMLAKEDPWPNILRLNSACFGAVCGGADKITLLPFTRPLGLPTPFARRVSRNIQLLHMEETRLGHVHDPAHGSYMHESLCYDLAQKAWELFQNIEKDGGWHKGCEAFMQRVKAVNQSRLQKISDGNILLVGVNQFVNSDVRKAKILPRPKLKNRTGKPIDARSFTKAVEQANAGQLIPMPLSREDT